MMAALGVFVFELRTVPYQSLQKQQTWRHGFTQRVARRPAQQFIGPDTDVITLSGTLYPSLTGGKVSLLALELMADSGKAWSFIDGTGTIHGMFVITDLQRTHTEFFQDGAARKIDFSLTLKRVDDSISQMLGDLSDQLGMMANGAGEAIKGVLS
ncbi:phage tail protein [Proteus mirabilis]|uniref:phage tail protein n=1 Tax=Proteus mirabilis TaxID=584 RepID=UPI000CE07779|nr:phage tail protein [Proteus mirabilis]AVA40859.1 phage tail protein [Proteus mirabilis]ELA6786844.1 phage tail protein [Proteus mirabilis]ELB1101129.1 phage tail protein [Proteus mirabilis]MBG2801252.1 phage tail protein [Proteus mirabilis]MBT0655724.1 phage tail protein [Proteus mirabilis]